MATGGGEAKLGAEPDGSRPHGVATSLWERLPSGLLLLVLWVAALLAAVLLVLGWPRGLH